MAGSRAGCPRRGDTRRARRLRYVEQRPLFQQHGELREPYPHRAGSDCTACSVVGATSIVDQLEGAHISWRAYMEDLPQPCFTGTSAGEYAKKHDPFVCHDMHDCSVATGDRFLSSLVPPLLRSLGPRGVLFITWDEGTSDAGCCRLASGGHVATIVAGPGAKRGLHELAEAAVGGRLIRIGAAGVSPARDAVGCARAVWDAWV